MEGEFRRKEIIDLLAKSARPVSGTEIAKVFGVSRQVIVQDIALLRAVDRNILSTNKGYLLHRPSQAALRAKRTLQVCHTDEQLPDELYTIVDFGGTVLDVVVEHEIYGQIAADLLLKDRRDVDEFLEKLARVHAKPLKELTGGNHLHTVEATSEQLLDIIEGKLGEKGYLVL